jgi:Flp pilus assembly protein TadG
MNSKSIYRHCKGLYSLEFVLVSILFFFMIFMVVEVGGLLYKMNNASEVTRLGARVAAVCNKNANGIYSQMIARFPALTNANINLQYLPDGCSQATCQTITVSLQNVTVTASTILPTSIAIPSFPTTLPRESMDSTLNPTVCN